MKLALPLSAFLVVLLLQLATYLGWLPAGDALIIAMQNHFSDTIFWLAGGVILLEALVYVGFYFPGQWIAVLLVLVVEPGWYSLIWLTLIMVVAATSGSLINFSIGRFLLKKGVQLTPPGSHNNASIRSLLVAMIHINALAFYMLHAGNAGKNVRIIWLAGLLNLPYYLLIIFTTQYFRNDIAKLADNSWLLLGAVSLWLLWSLVRQWPAKQASV